MYIIWVSHAHHIVHHMYQALAVFAVCFPSIYILFLPCYFQMWRSNPHGERQVTVQCLPYSGGVVSQTGSQKG